MSSCVVEPGTLVKMAGATGVLPNEAQEEDASELTFPKGEGKVNISLYHKLLKEGLILN